MGIQWGKFTGYGGKARDLVGAGAQDLDRRLANAKPASSEHSEFIAVRAEDCAPWHGNPANREPLTEQNCRSLIEAIGAQRRNTVPAKVRRTPGADKPYEVLVGHRRRFAVEWLNHNGRPEILLHIQLVDMTDEEVFRLVDAKYRDRDDVCELDRAHGYEVAVDRFYGGVQSRMAEALGYSNSQISRLLSLAQMPHEVVQAFATPEELRVRHAEVLTPLLRRPAQQARIVHAAIDLAREQQTLALRREPLIPAAMVLARLKQAALATDIGSVDGDQFIVQVDGVAIGLARPDRNGGVLVELVLNAGTDCDAVSQQLRQAIEMARSLYNHLE